MPKLPPGLVPGLLAVLLLAPSARAAEPNDEPAALKAQVEDLRRGLDEMKARHEAEVQALEDRIRALEAASPSATPPPPSAPKSADDAALEAELAKALASDASSAKPEPAPASGPPAGGGGRMRLLDLSLGALFAGGGSTANEAQLQALQGGGHDPKQRGVTLQNLELSFAGAVDPYLRADAHLVYQLTPDGESTFEVEEAYLTTQSLPHGLQLKAGQYFTEFGRINPQHPHQWAFVDAPVVSTRMFGEDGLRGPGARLSWLLPSKWYSELNLGVQNARGETAYSFFGAKDEQQSFAGHPLVDDQVKTAGDLLYTARWLNSLSVSGATTLNLGLSAATGPNSTGGDARTSIYGFDMYLKWTKPGGDKGFPFVAWQTEALMRDYEGAAFVDGSGTAQPREALRDQGAYSQVVWGFHRGWTWGLRGDWADGEQGLVDDKRLDPTRDRRVRLSTELTWYPTEFSKLRFQINRDRAEFLGGGDTDEATSAWLQWEFNLGAHGAHQF